MDWRKIRKIDAHVHLLPSDRLDLFKNTDDPWAHADTDLYLKLMDQYNVEKAVLMPTNDGRLYYEKAEKTNQWLGEMQKSHPDRFLAFADILKEGAYFYEDTPDILDSAVREHGLKGLKIHPQNLNLDADGLEFVPVLRKAAELNVPVVIHSNPCQVGFHENSAPDKINKMIRIFPDINFITAHMGGMKWPDAITGCSYVDISGVLPQFVNLYGIEQTNRILRRFGADRLIFATDYPDVWFTKPEEVYDTYCSLLNQMDFTEQEAEQIAYKNAARLLGIDSL